MSIDSARRAIEGDGATRGVQHSRLADILLLSVEGHDVARCRQPQRKTHTRRLFEVGTVQDLLVGHRVGCTMTRVVHDKGATLHLLADKRRHVRITEAR